MSALTARKPMQRTGLNRRRKLALAAPIDREKRLSDAAKYAIENALKKPPNLAQISLSTPAAPVEKESPLRSEAYRRAVASLPCIHCGIDGYSQCSSIKLAATLGIASSTVRAVRIGQNWSHLTGRGKLKQHQEGGSDAT